MLKSEVSYSGPSKVQTGQQKGYDLLAKPAKKSLEANFMSPKTKTELIRNYE